MDLFKHGILTNTSPDPDYAVVCLDWSHYVPTWTTNRQISKHNSLCAADGSGACSTRTLLVRQICNAIALVTSPWAPRAKSGAALTAVDAPDAGHLPGIDVP